jgi:hypothetical protein
MNLLKNVFTKLGYSKDIVPSTPPPLWKALNLDDKEALYVSVCALLSELIYDHEHFAVRCYEWFDPLEIYMNENFSADATIFALVVFKEFKVVCVRGSVTIHDWTHNLTFETIDDSTTGLCGLHRGFFARSLDIPGDNVLSSRRRHFQTHHLHGYFVLFYVPMTYVCNSNTV